MIKEVELLKDYTDFVDSFYSQDEFIDPHIYNEDDKNNLLNEKREIRSFFW